MFFRNCDPTFDQSLFSRAKSGRQLIRDGFQDESIWTKGYQTKDDENWSWVGGIHPTYFPFDEVTWWICDDLVEKFGDKDVERTERMNKASEEKFIKRIAKIYVWKGAREGRRWTRRWRSCLREVVRIWRKARTGGRFSYEQEEQEKEKWKD